MSASDRPETLDRLAAEFIDLGLRAVVGVPTGVVTGNLRALKMGKIRPTRVGRDLERLMELGSAIPASELQNVIYEGGLGPTERPARASRYGSS